MIAIGSIMNYATTLIAERRRRPGDDMITVLLEAEVDAGPGSRRLTEDEVASFVILLVGAGVETVARLLSWRGGDVVARHPGERRLLVEDPSLIPGAVEELLRYEAPSPVNGRWTLRAIPCARDRDPGGGLEGAAAQRQRQP